MLYRFDKASRPNIGLTFKSVPEGLGMVCALLFCTNHAKGFIRLKHVLVGYSLYEYIDVPGGSITTSSNKS